jgi:hypothetical protein
VSVPLAFALYFGAMGGAGLRSLDREGPALSVRASRRLAGALVAVGLIGAVGHWFGLVLPCTIALISLANDPVVSRLWRWIAR